MLQKVKERLMMWGYTFTTPEEPEAPAANEPEQTEDPAEVEETTEETEDQADSGAAEDPEGPETPAEEEPTPDELMILFLIEKTEAYIKNYCNITEIPEELIPSEVDMVAAEFLRDKAMSGGLATSSLQVDAISSVTEGDVSVSYSSGSSITLPNLFKSISEQFAADLIPFRRLRW